MNYRTHQLMTMIKMMIKMTIRQTMTTRHHHKLPCLEEVNVLELDHNI